MFLVPQKPLPASCAFIRTGLGVAGLEILVGAYKSSRAYMSSTLHNLPRNMLSRFIVIASSEAHSSIIRVLSEANGGRKEGRKEEKHGFHSEMGGWMTHHPSECIGVVTEFVYPCCQRN